jgi:oligoribonuclease NrnB/cAMP/cGMP phosphodiesterase (DHH superfamily)
MPWFIQYIQDRDIWKFELPRSREVNAGMYFNEHTSENYDLYMTYENENSHVKDSYVESIADLGKIVLDTQLRIVKGIAHGPTVKYQTYVSECWTTGMPPKRVPCDDQTLLFAIVCCPFSLISDLGSYMLNYEKEQHSTNIDVLGEKVTNIQVPDVVICYNKLENESTHEGTPYNYSLRSKQDVLWFVKLFDGGGHPNACGFKSLIPPHMILSATPTLIKNRQWGIGDVEIPCCG